MNFMSLNNQGLGHKAKKGWINILCSHHKLNFNALQEIKMESIDVIPIESVCGNYSFDHAVSSSVGNSECILCIWDPNMFIKDHVSASDYFLAIMGTWVPSSTKLLVISVYALQELSKKRELWSYFGVLIEDGMVRPLFLVTLMKCGQSMKGFVPLLTFRVLTFLITLYQRQV